MRSIKFCRTIRAIRTIAWARRALPALVLPGLISAAAAPASATAGTATAALGLRPLTYLGNTFEIPGGWLVLDLARHPGTCVRFDRHAVYLGTPSPDQACPSHLAGTTEAMLIGPAAGQATQAPAVDAVTRRVTAVTGQLAITASFGADPGLISQILASDHLPHPVSGPAGPVSPGPAAGGRPAAQAPALPGPAATNFHGDGFDTCAAPSGAAMAAWRHRSPFGAVGIYLGGSDEACAQPNLTPAWLVQQAAAGWHFIPLYVGPQAAFGELRAAPAGQAAAAAADAVRQAKRLGLGPGAALYYDMEGYPSGQSARVLAFLSAWTTRLHSLGYSSGVYSSSSSGVANLARHYADGHDVMPNVIFDAWWNGHADTRDPVLGPSQWVPHRRLHQFRGNVRQAYGGVALQIDWDFLDVSLPRPASSP